MTRIVIYQSTDKDEHDHRWLAVERPHGAMASGPSEEIARSRLARALAVRTPLLESEFLEPPPGWKPLGTDDLV